MTMSLRRLIAAVALAMLVALAPPAASARIIQLSFTGIVTGGQSDALGVSGDIGNTPDSPTVSGTVTFRKTKGDRQTVSVIPPVAAE